MKFESNFTTDKTRAEVVELSTTYFVSQGFSLKSNQSDTLLFNRGSQLSNYYTFNTLKLQSQTTIYFRDNGHTITVQAKVEVNTAGQAITSKDQTIWKSFVSNYEKSVLSGQDLSSQTQQILQQGKKANLKYMGWAILGAVLAGVPSGFIAHWTGIGTIASMGTVVGAIGLMFYKINQDKEQEPESL